MAEVVVCLRLRSRRGAQRRGALRQIERKQYGLAIVDYQMPGMNGVDLFRKMRERRPDLTGIFLTGYTTIDVVYPAIEAGILHVLPKPADFQELVPIIEEHLGSADLERCATRSFG